MKAVLACLCAAVAVAETVTVDTPLGPVKGISQGGVNVFRGIPYAEPPVGAHRWAPTEPVKAWGPSALDATKDAPGCPQACALPPHTCPPTTSEDCLYANVFAPAGSSKSLRGSGYPVMVWVHGGNFKQGYPGGLLYNGSSMASSQGVVVVAIAYRLGALGWLYSGGGTIEGMYGALDQQEALRWVAANIAAFGGDPDQVTMFGQSAGAMSVATHMTWDSSKDLFHRGILESDPFTSPFRTPEEFAKLGSAFGQKLGCSDTSGPGLDACLRAADVSDLITAQVAVEKDLAVDMPHVLEAFLPWTPLVDTQANATALRGQPRDIFAAGMAQQKPMIVGTVQNEALLFIWEAFGKPMSPLEYDAYLAVVFGIGKAITVGEKYPLPSKYDDDARYWLAHIGTRGLFQCPTRNASLGQALVAPTWVYHFDHIMSFSKQVWGPNFTVCYDAVCHAEELAFVWHPDAQLLNLSYTAGEQVLSRDMESYWGSFARTGNPNAPAAGTTDWPVFHPATEHTMLLQTPKSTVLTKNYTAECNWWSDVIGYDFP